MSNISNNNDAVDGSQFSSFFCSNEEVGRIIDENGSMEYIMVHNSDRITIEENMSTPTSVNLQGLNGTRQDLHNTVTVQMQMVAINGNVPPSAVDATLAREDAANINLPVLDKLSSLQ
jgi:hypothetical protein